MITTEQVWDEIGTPDPGELTPDGLNMIRVVEAVNVLIPNTVPSVREQADPTVWAADITRAAVMQASRLFARRNSPTGVAAYTDTGPAYIARWDPDLEKLLRIGAWTIPRIG